MKFGRYVRLYGAFVVALGVIASFASFGRHVQNGPRWVCFVDLARADLFGHGPRLHHASHRPSRLPNRRRCCHLHEVLAQALSRDRQLERLFGLAGQDALLITRRTGPLSIAPLLIG